MATTTHSIETRTKGRSLNRAIAAHRLNTVALYAFLIVGCTLTLVPFIWMILTSFKPPAEVIKIPPTLWPETPTIANYQTILSDPKLPLWRFYLNSIFVSGSVVLLTLFTSSLAGFIFAKYQFAGKNIIFGFILATLMIPFQVTMIPAYLLLVKVSLIDSLWGLVVPSAVSAFGIFLMKQFVEGLPSELLDAARIDGASEWTIYWRLILPQIGPALATLGILTFMGTWNSYLWPLIVITTHEERTLPVILSWYNSAYASRPHLTMTTAVLVVMPILFVYTLFQRWIVQGFTLSGFK